MPSQLSEITHDVPCLAGTEGRLEAVGPGSFAPPDWIGPGFRRCPREWTRGRGGNARAHYPGRLVRSDSSGDADAVVEGGRCSARSDSGALYPKGTGVSMPTRACVCCWFT